MLILLLVLAVIFLTLVGLAYFFYNRLTTTKGELFSAKRQLLRLQEQHRKTEDAARLAEQRWEVALQHLQVSLGNTDEALQIAKQIRGVGEAVHALNAYVMHPLDEPTNRGRHSRSEDAEEVYVP